MPMPMLQPHAFAFAFSTTALRPALSAAAWLAACALAGCAAPATAPVAAPAAVPQANVPQPVALPGAPRDAAGCIPSAGYSWCTRMASCVRPWELAGQQGFARTEGGFNDFCGNAAPAAGLLMDEPPAPAR